MNTYTVAFVAYLVVLIMIIKYVRRAPMNKVCYGCTQRCTHHCANYPLIAEIKSAYVVKHNMAGSVTASTTLTFKHEHVVAQSPSGGDQPWQIPNLVGIHKVAVKTWGDDSNVFERRTVVFS